MQSMCWWCIPYDKSPISKWVFPKIGVPQNGWFIMENRIKIDDLGVRQASVFWVPQVAFLEGGLPELGGPKLVWILG